MGRRLWSLVCLGVSVLVLVGAAPALAQGGTSTSAGDQQYVDPLGNTTPTNSGQSSSSPSSTSTPPASSSSAPASSAPAASPSPPSTPAPTTTTTHADPSGTLPFTGLNVGLLVAIGLGLVVAGLLLRRVARRT